MCHGVGICWTNDVTADKVRATTRKQQLITPAQAVFGRCMLGDIMMACGNTTAQSLLMLSQATQACIFLCHMAKAHSFGNSIFSGS